MKRYKLIERMMRKIRRTIFAPYYFVKYGWQRSRRGFSDRDMWNADMYLAGLIADVLQWYIDKGHGVPMHYAYDLDKYSPDVEIMSDRRDDDYMKRIRVFREYAENGCAMSKEWKKQFGGVTEKQIKKELSWFRDNFTTLWD